MGKKKKEKIGKQPKTQKTESEILLEKKLKNDALREEENAEIREQRARIFFLNETENLLQTINAKVETIKAKQHSDNNWNEYLDCKNLPNGYRPQELRDYLYKFMYQEHEYLNDPFHWILRTDERSILCQNYMVPDITIQNVRSHIPNIGEHFVDKLHDVLQIMFNIDRTLEIVSGDLYNEIKEIKSSYRDLASKYTDILTFYNLSNVERNMVSINPTESLYECDSDIISMHLWSYRNVPKEPSEYVSKHIDLNSINAEINIPMTIDCDNSAIRGLWLRYDHLSSEAPTFSMTNDPGLFPDTIESMTASFDIKYEMKKILLDIMAKEYAEYELAQELAEKEKAVKKKEEGKSSNGKVPKSKKNKKGNKSKHKEILPEEIKSKSVHELVPEELPDPNAKKVMEPVITVIDYVTNYHNQKKVVPANPTSVKKKKESKKKKKGKNKEDKPPPGPPMVDENTCINVDDVYSVYMEYLHKKRQEGISAEYLPLEEFDINMRKYIVNGGVFPIHHLERAMQPREFINNMTLTSKNLPSTLIYKDFYASYEPPPKHDLYIEEPIKEINAPDENNNINGIDQINEINKPNETTVVTNDVHEDNEISKPNEINKLIEINKANDIKEIKKENPFDEINEKRKTIIVDELKLKEELALDKKNKAKLIEISMILPNITCWWHTPIVCRWEPWEESPEFMNLDPRQQYYNLNYEAHHETKRRKLFNAPFASNENIPTNFDDFNMYNIPSLYKKKMLVTKHIITRLPENYKYEYEKEMELLEKEKHERMIESQKVEDAKVMDDCSCDRFMQNEYNVYHRIPANQIKHEPPRDLFRGRMKIIPIEINKDVEVEVGQGDENRFVLFSELLQELDNEVESEKPIFIDTVTIPSGNRVSRLSTKRPTSMTSSLGKSKSSVSKAKIKKSAKDLKKKRKTEYKVIEEEEEEVPIIQKPKFKYELTPHTLGKWSTRDIYLTQYNPESKRITFKTGKFGIFAFVVERYSNLPLKHWNLKPDPENPNSSVILTILTNQMIELTITITSKGFKLSVIKPTTFDIPYPKETIHLKVLKAAMIDIGLNIFPELDAVEYIEGIVEKQGSMEFHSYSCIGPFCLTHEFTRSFWNHESPYNTVIIDTRETISGFENKVMIKPEYVAFVDVKELCTDLSIIELEFVKNPIEQEFYADLYYILSATSVEPSIKKQKSTRSMLIRNVMRIMKCIRPFSFSM